MVSPHLAGERDTIWQQTAISAAITHNDPLAIASAVAWVGLLWRLLDGSVRDAIAGDIDVKRAGLLWYSGAYLLETIPTVMHIVARHGHQPVVAIETAVNDTRDNDTVAAVVGAALGAQRLTATRRQRRYRSSSVSNRMRGSPFTRARNASVNPAAEKYK